MIKKIVFFLVLLSCVSAFGQKINVEKYQYIIVPNQFDFLKSTDEYQTSSLMKFLFEKKGFKVFLSNNKFPIPLEENKCLALFASVKDNSSMFRIKSSIEIKDCFGKILYTSEAGISKSKEYKKGYQEAIRNAFDAMTDFEFSYNSSKVVNKNNDGESTYEIKTDTLAVPLSTIPKTISIPVIKKQEVNKESIKSTFGAILYAQSIENGFQLINKKPEVVFVILRTSKKDFFIIRDKNGIFYKNEDHFLAEYYEGSTLIKKEFQVKF
ncbi:hypothetical protein K8354_01195 [Polaribacter litorisediminis]|uniref:hypothetical protein n=1 Tax=Polaribacter litorisediminis TaxID=1908341 RepID=UPI001CC012AC|nr:hypothetical protein [Polaribacter litorisediminis]UAM98474.1 hypothetical protein K8354_01195 [Polaribacter litorisediminis]